MAANPVNVSSQISPARFLHRIRTAVERLTWLVRPGKDRHPSGPDAISGDAHSRSGLIDHLLENLGEDHLGLGSDFDGATLPNGIGDVTGQTALQQAMLAHGYGTALVQKICYDNWLALLDRTWAA